MAWRLEEHSSEHRLRCRYSIYDDMRPVAYAFELSEARKLAAAPAMLEALKAARKRIYVEMTHTIERAVLEEMSEELRQIDAALAAAEPEPKADKP